MENANKIIKISTTPLDENSSKVRLDFEGYSVMEQCSNTAQHGSFFLEEHSLFFLLDGSLKLTHGKDVFELKKNEMILFKKATFLKFEKSANGGPTYDCIIVSIKDAVLKSFLTSSNMKPIAKPDAEANSAIFPMPECQIHFAQSVKMYLSGTYPVQEGQIHIKMMEMLYNIAIGSQPMYAQLLQFDQPIRVDIQSVIEANYTSPASLQELAYLSGRSLSAFKRDFQNIFNMPPAQLIREKRLAKAKDLLETTAMSISDICYAVGFENVSHFSRIFKDLYGISPSSYRHHL